MTVHLQEADVSLAHLEEADLRSAYLEKAALMGAHLEKARLGDAEGHDARGLTPQQLAEASWDKSTVLPLLPARERQGDS